MAYKNLSDDDEFAQWPVRFITSTKMLVFTSRHHKKSRNFVVIVVGYDASMTKLFFVIVKTVIRTSTQSMHGVSDDQSESVYNYMPLS